MATLIEKSILNERLEKSRSGIYADTSENRRKHRVGQKYGSEKKEEEKPEKTSSNKDPEKELEAVNKVIAAINEGKLTLPNDQIMVLVEKKSKLEAAKKQAEKINAGVKANEEKKESEEVKETNKKINEAQKKEASKELSETDMRTAIATKFVNWEVPTLDELKGSKVYILREKLNNGGRMNREEKDWLTEKVNSNTYFKSAVPLQGWKFDFSDILRTYIVKQYGHWTEYKATDKTALRNFLYGRIDNIVELEK